MTAIAPESAAAMPEQESIRDLLLRWRKQIGAGIAVLVLALLVLIDHSGTPPIVDEAVGPGVAAATVGVTTAGDARLQAVPGTVHVVVDAAKLVEVTVTLRNSAAQALVVDADGRLLASSSGLVEGFASGGVVVPAHGTAVLTLTGTPPFSTVGSVALQLHATPQRAS